MAGDAQTLAWRGAGTAGVSSSYLDVVWRRERNWAEMLSRRLKMSSASETFTSLREPPKSSGAGARELRSAAGLQAESPPRQPWRPSRSHRSSCLISRGDICLPVPQERLVSDTDPGRGQGGLGPTFRVGISEGLKVMPEELLLLRRLGQGAVGYAGPLRLGKLFFRGAWAACIGRWRRKGQVGEAVNMSHGRRHLPVESGACPAYSVAGPLWFSEHRVGAVWGQRLLPVPTLGQAWVLPFPLLPGLPCRGSSVRANRGVGSGRGGEERVTAQVHSKSASDSPESAGAGSGSGAAIRPTLGKPGLRVCLPGH